MVRRQISRERRAKKNIENGAVYIRSTLNNIIVTITDEPGNILSWSSAGALGSKGLKKSTPFAVQMAFEIASKSVMEHGLKTVGVTVKGPGPGRESAIRVLQLAGLEVTAIRDVTPVSYNGCRPSKRRRV